jgi:hypothetical protein
MWPRKSSTKTVLAVCGTVSSSVVHSNLSHFQNVLLVLKLSHSRFFSSHTRPSPDLSSLSTLLSPMVLSRGTLTISLLLTCSHRPAYVLTISCQSSCSTKAQGHRTPILRQGEALARNGLRCWSCLQISRYHRMYTACLASHDLIFHNLC